MSSPGDVQTKDNFRLADQPASHDLDSALVEVAEKLEFAEFLPLERIKAGITEIVLGILVFGAVIVVCGVR